MSRYQQPPPLCVADDVATRSLFEPVDARERIFRRR
jgi:hypothetical protein